MIRANIYGGKINLSVHSDPTKHSMQGLTFHEARVLARSILEELERASHFPEFKNEYALVDLPEIPGNL